MKGAAELVWLVACVVASSACRAAEPTEGSFGTLERFAPLAADGNRESQGYFFSVSPDEQWIVEAVERPSDELRLLHVATGKSWRHALPGAWYPNCFAPDSSRLYVGELSAPLSPDMPALVFERDTVPKDLEGLEGAFPGFDGTLRDRSGVRVSSWRELPERDRNYGLSAWSADGRILYELVGDQLRITPPGQTRSIDVSPVRQAIDRRVSQSMEESVRSAATPKERKDAERAVELLSAADELLRKMRGPPTFRSMAVSPNGRWLAASAWVQAVQSGPGAGVLIDLGTEELRARPYAIQLYGVLGKPIWSRDSERLYFYGEATWQSNTGKHEYGSAVYRLQLPSN